MSQLRLSAQPATMSGGLRPRPGEIERAAPRSWFTPAGRRVQGPRPDEEEIMHTTDRLRMAIICMLAATGTIQFGPAQAQAKTTAQEILKTAAQRYETRMKGVRDYTVIQSTAGVKTTQRFERVGAEDGPPVFRQVASLRPSEAEGGIAGPGGQKGGGAAENMVDMYTLLNELAPRAVLDGTEKIDGRDAYVVSVDDLSGIDLAGMTGTAQQGGAYEGAFQPRTLRLWLDTQRYVTLRTLLTGIAEVDGKTTEVTFDIRPSDYRDIDGVLYPFKTDITIEGIGGTLSDEQRAKLEKARAEMEKQLEGMSDEQRAMVEKTMKDRLPDFDSMMAPGPTSVAIEVEDVRVNENRKESMPPGGTYQPGVTEHMERGIEPVASLEDLTPEYMEGEWCTKGLEPALFRFYQDGSYDMALAEQQRVDTSGNPSSYQSFLDMLKGADIIEMTRDQFRVDKDGRETLWIRDCSDPGLVK
jgi:hypothetical protein